jgi:hypothetical protein
MDVKTLIQTAVPTPFGWVIQTQEDVHLNATLAFQGQLISLSKICGPIVSAAQMDFNEIGDVEVGVLVPVRVSSERPRI